MKLGKALATGVAEERPADHHHDEAERPEEQALAAPAEPAREEVPAAR